MNEKVSLVSAGAAIARRNKRYVVWFYLLNLVFAWLGTAAFSTHAHGVLDHSLYADKLLHGFDAAVLIEMFARPEFGPIRSSTAPSTVFAALFFLVSMIFMPGVLLGYSSDHRISRDEFFRTSGHNVWRFVRLFLFFAVIAGIIAGILFGAQSALVKAIDQSSNDDRLPFVAQMLGLAIVFLVLTVIRIWFDLAQTDVVLRDQVAVRRSLTVGFQAMRRNLWRLLRAYVSIAIVALALFVAGIWLWHAIVPPSSVAGAFIISQTILLLLLATRFCQRACAVAFHVRQTTESVLEIRATPGSAELAVSS